MNREGFSILDLYGEDHAAEANDTIHQDLNLTQVVDHMAARFGRGVRNFYKYMPEDLYDSVEFLLNIGFAHGDDGRPSVRTVIRIVEF